MKRWKAVVTYRGGSGFIDVEHHIEELSEIEELVENGPDWNSIERIEITLARITVPQMTVEQDGVRSL